MLILDWIFLWVHGSGCGGRRRGGGVGFCYGSSVGVYVEVQVTMLVVGGRFAVVLWVWFIGGGGDG